LILLLMIIASGYLIIYNIFYIAVSADIRYYGLLKTIGTTNRQLKRIIVRQAALLSLIAIPAGMLLGYLISVVILPVITGSFLNIPCHIHPDVRIFAASAVFSWLTVRISCIEPCRVIRKTSPVEAVGYSEYSADKLPHEKKTRKVSSLSMAWENLKRSRRKTAVVVLSLALSIIMINVTVSIISSFDKNMYIKQYAITDFMVTDGSMLSRDNQDMDYEGVSPGDIRAISGIDGVTDSGAIYMTESLQNMEGMALERVTKTYAEHPDWFVIDEEQQQQIETLIYDTKKIDSHIYGIDEFLLDSMDIDKGEIDWGKFGTGKYVIVSSPLKSGNGKEGAEYAFYQIGEKINVTFPDGKESEYEVLAVGDVPYAMGPEHSHGLDVYFTIPENEYLQHVPDSRGAMKLFFNADETKMDAVDEAVSQYCAAERPELGYTSRRTYLEDFRKMIDTFLLVGGVLSAVLALIGILNLINLCVTSINERRNEFAVLRAVGMTRKQLTRMLVGEGVLRICLAFAFVLTVGLLLNYVIVNLVAGQMTMFSYRFVVWPILVCIPVFTVLSVAVSEIAARQPHADGFAFKRTFDKL
ncbi:MAG: ABC transporter permease, partial [Bacillota bacterium]